MDYQNHTTDELADELHAISKELYARGAEAFRSCGGDERAARLHEHQDQLHELAETLREGEKLQSKVRAHHAQNAVQGLVAGLLGGAAADPEIEEFALHLLEELPFITGVKAVSEKRARAALQDLYKCDPDDAEFLLEELEERPLPITGVIEDDLQRYDKVFEITLYDGDNIPDERMTYSPKAFFSL